MRTPVLYAKTLFALVCVAGMSLVSCRNGGETIVQFVSVPGEIPLYNEAGFDNRVPESRVPSGGYIYTVGTSKGETVRLEPLALVPGTDLVLSGLRSGLYEYLALYYSPELLAPEAAWRLPLPGTVPEEFWLVAGADPVAEELLDNSGAVALFQDLSVRWIRKKKIEAALVPLSSEIFQGPAGNPPRCPDTNGEVRKQFVRLEPNGAGRIYVMLSNFDGEGIVYAGTVSLYSTSGAKLESKTFNRDIPPDNPESVMFTLPFDDVSYLYLEYAAKGSRALPLYYF